MNRRQFVSAAALLPLAGCKLPFSFEQGMMHPCAPGLPPALAAHPMVQAALANIRNDQVWDCHAHLLGNGREGSGIWVDPAFDGGEGIRNKVQRTLFANSACLGENEAKWDSQMIARLSQLAAELPIGFKVMVMAFDFTYDDTGKRRDDLTTFSVPNRYAAMVAAANKDRFEWTASVHPWRPDAIDELNWCHANGARAVKWLPPTMGIDLAHPKCVPFFRRLRELDLPLLTHVGKELSVRGAHREEFGHPLALRHPLGEGVRVIAAHCASLGESPDTDKPGAPMTANFDLFGRLMDDPKHAELLYGDISATILFNRDDAMPIEWQRLSAAWRDAGGVDQAFRGARPHRRGRRAGVARSAPCQSAAVRLRAQAQPPPQWPRVARIRV
jgi:uncharacterized protein